MNIYGVFPSGKGDPWTEAVFGIDPEPPEEVPAVGIDGGFCGRPLPRPSAASQTAAHDLIRLGVIGSDGDVESLVLSVGALPFSGSC